MKSIKKGIAKFRCPVCDYEFKLWRGRKLNPRVEEVNAWLYRARCPKCGILIKAHRKDDRGYRSAIC